MAVPVQGTRWDPLGPAARAAPGLAQGCVCVSKPSCWHGHSQVGEAALAQQETEAEKVDGVGEAGPGSRREQVGLRHKMGPSDELSWASGGRRWVAGGLVSPHPGCGRTEPRPVCGECGSLECTLDGYVEPRLCWLQAAQRGQEALCDRDREDAGNMPSQCGARVQPPAEGSPLTTTADFFLTI